MQIEHWMIFGTFAEQNYFIYPSTDSYEGVILNANMVTHAPAGLAAFLISKTKNVSYIIDPLTHAFQHPVGVIQNEDGEVKNSFNILAEIYGNPITDYVGKKPLLPQAFDDDDLKKQFVKNCLDFQKNYLKNKIVSNDDSKYLENDGITFHPKFLIAPYFYLTEITFNRWFPIQVNLTELACKFNDGDKIYSELVLDQGTLLSDKLILEIISAYSSLSNNGFIVWIDDFNESEASQKLLENYIHLINGLSNQGQKRIINLHGSYFSIALAGIQNNKGLTGIAHSPEYGEYRSVIPVGGGIPISKFYIPKLHQRYKFRDALQILRSGGFLDSTKLFYENVCDCNNCKLIINDNPDNFLKYGESNVRSITRGNGTFRMEFPTSEAKENCLKHYLLIKKQEYTFASMNTKDQILAELSSGIQLFEELIGTDGISHLLCWKEVLAKI